MMQHVLGREDGTPHRFGDESEAISYVGDYGSAWRNPLTAIDWVGNEMALDRGANPEARSRHGSKT